MTESARRLRIIRAALLLAATAPYLNTLSNGFVYDDHPQVVRNELVRSLDPRPILEHGAVTHGRVEWYRPLTVYTFAVNYAASGLNPVSYHAVNIGLHAANTLLVFAVGRRLLLSVPAAAAAAALFGVHAVHTEAVAAVFGRSDLLAGFFVLLGWHVALGARAVCIPRLPRTGVLRMWPHPWRTAAVSVALFLGLLSKESAIALLPVLLISHVILHDASQRGLKLRFTEIVGRRWPMYVALGMTVGAYAALRYATAGGIVAEGAHVRYIENPLVEAGPLARVFTSFWITLKYVVLWFVPHQLSVDYSYNQIPVLRTPADPRVVAVLVFLAGGAGTLEWLRKREPRGVLLVVAFAVLLLPVSNLIVPIGTVMAERLMYLPSAAFCLLAGLGVDAWYQPAQSARRTIAVPALFLAVCAAHVAAVVHRNRDWASEERLFASAVRASPASAKARFNYGSALLESGRADEARAMLQAAVTIAPAYPEAHNLLGTLALSLGHVDTARAAFEAALRDAPDYPPALANLGSVRRREGNLREARRLLESAVAADPSMAVAHVNLALVAELQGDHGAAIEHYRRAYALDPTLTVARERAEALGSRERH